MHGTMCRKCNAPMAVVGAHSFGTGAWEVAMLCSSWACKGYQVVDHKGRLHESPPIDTTTTRMGSILREAIKYKERRGSAGPALDRGKCFTYADYKQEQERRRELVASKKG